MYESKKNRKIKKLINTWNHPTPVKMTL
jgi:hypothetical protein